MPAIDAQMGPGQGEFFIPDNFSISFRLLKIKQETIIHFKKIPGPCSSKKYLLKKGKEKLMNCFQLMETNKNSKTKCNE